MEPVAGPPTRWLVELHDGSKVEVWADAVTGLAGPDDDRDYVFGVLMDVDADQQPFFEVTARTPTNPRRVEVAVARFPRHAVVSIYTTRDSEL
jgi:hypothetical protein